VIKLLNMMNLYVISSSSQNAGDLKTYIFKHIFVVSKHRDFICGVQVDRS